MHARAGACLSRRLADSYQSAHDGYGKVRCIMDSRLKLHPHGFLEVVDRPTPDELREYYARSYYQNEKGTYRKEYPADELEVFSLRIAQRAAQACSIRGTDVPGRLLDVGCGEGFVLRDFDRMGWNVEGIDFSRAGVERMNPDFVEQVDQGDVFELLDWRIKSEEQYDLVWLGNVLEHVLDPIGLLKSLRQLVNEDGLLIVTVPNDGNAYQEELFQKGKIPERFWIAIPDHMSYFTAASLKQTAEATGWNCKAMHAGFPIDWYLAHEGSNYVVDRARGPSAHKARLMLERHIGMAGPEAANTLFSALADVGLGRDLTAFLQPDAADQSIE